MGMRASYWSCSKFADWLRGTSKPSAATGLGWAQWNKASKDKHPIRYWIAEEGLDYIQTTLSWPVDKLYDVKYYINNRWVTRTHSLTAHPRDIKPGQWCDVGNRFLPCLFNELVDFVEVELAWANFRWDEAQCKKHKVPWWAKGWFRWRSYRNKAAGLDYLNWAMDLKADETWGLKPGDPGYGEPTHQAIASKEIFELYRWWTETRPSRPDPFDVSGWSEHCDIMRDKAKNMGYSNTIMIGHEIEDQDDQERSRKALDLSTEYEKKFEEEDEEMMIRLIKVRQSLWT